MLKQALFIGILATPAMAEPWDLDIPSLEEQNRAAEAASFQDMLTSIQTSPDFAGTYSALSFRGQRYVVDRRAEPVSKKPGASPASVKISAFVNSLSAEARGSVHISVSYTYNTDGSIKSENWAIDFQGSWQSQAGMDDSMGKSHK